MAMHLGTGTAQETSLRKTLRRADTTPPPEKRSGSRYSLSFVRSMLAEGSAGAEASFRELSLRSAFQPIFSLPHKRAIGFDASVRSANSRGQPIAAETLFGAPNADTTLLDMLCSALHVQNFYSFHRQQGLLFLNLHAAVFLDSQSTAEFLGELLRHCRVPADRLVIDVHDSVLDSAGLCSALEDYRRIGCLIAIDDFGLDHKNLDSIWDCNATLVKMAPPVIAQAAADRGARQALVPAVSLLHEMGVLVHMEGIENEVQALLAIDADADFASGFYFGRALAENLEEHADHLLALDTLWNTYKHKRNWSERKGSQPRASLQGETLRSSQIRKLNQAPQEEIRRYRESRRPFLTAFRHAADWMSADMPFEIACQEFLQLPGAIRSYLLDGEGRQFGRDMPAYRPPAPQGVDFHAQGAPAASEWCRRDFFRRALNEPDVVQVTRQYCSLTGHAHCVTFSIAITLKSKPFVLCGDVDWSRIAKAD